MIYKNIESIKLKNFFYDILFINITFYLQLQTFIYVVHYYIFSD